MRYDRLILNDSLGRQYETFDPPWWQPWRWITWLFARTKGTTVLLTSLGGRKRLRIMETKAR